MTESEKKEHNQRLKSVEEAVIKFGNVIDIVLVDIKSRIKLLEKHDEEFQNKMHNSCDIKSKEIDRKVGESEIRSSDFIKDSRKESRWVSIAMFTLFISALVYFNYTDQQITEKVERFHDNTIKNNTNSEILINAVDKINKKLDQVIQHKHDRKEIVHRLETIEKYQNRNYGFLQGQNKKHKD